MMNDDRLERDSQQASLLQHLLGTPVGRRWLLKAGLGSAAAVAVANLPAWSAPNVLAQVSAGASPSAGGGSATGITLQFALGAALAGVGVQPTPAASPSASTTPKAAETPTSGATAEATDTARASDTPEATPTAEATRSGATTSAADRAASSTSGNATDASDGAHAPGPLVFGAMLAAATTPPTPAETATPTARPSTPTGTPTARASGTSTPHATSGATATPTAAASPSVTETPTASASPSPTGTTAPTAPVTPDASDPDGISNLVLIANGAQLPLIAHTDDSRAALKTQGGLWEVMDLQALTHYVTDVPLPSDRCMVVSVRGTRGSSQVLVSQLVYTPEYSRRALAQLAASGGGLKNLAGSGQRLQALGLTADQISSAEHLVQLDSIVDTGQSPAVALVFHHPNVSTIDPTAGPITTSLLGQAPEVQTLGSAISTLRQQGQDYATFVQATNDDHSPAQITIKGVTSGFSTIQLNQTDGNFTSALKDGVTAGLKGVRNSGDLGQVIDKPLDSYPKGTPVKTWVQSQGVTPQTKPYTPPATAAGGGIQAMLKVGYEPFQVPVSNGLVFGTGTQITSGYSNGQVQLKIYNNWVRWVWAYVQYIGKDGANLSLNAQASWPDTRYSQSLAVVPQVFTVLGVPIWDTNTVDVTLNFPKDAHTARLLYCGLGSDINGGGWRQYWPAGAYPDRIAPTDEALFAALTTGIVTIGINVFALATDIAAAAAWTAIRQNFEGAIDAWDAMLALTRASPVLTAAETAGTLVAAGGATYADIEGRGNNVTNLWSILVSLASAIPKILFSPATDKFWGRVAAGLIGAETALKIINAIPFIGEAIAVVTAVGDAATLAEVSVESAVAPWVIENEVNLTYQAQVTVKHDPRDATWPVTAQSWKLETKLDDAPSSTALTGDLNAGGRVQSDDLVLQVTAPFGSATVQWSLVVLDQGGHQVGTGVSAKLPNDDPNNPPTTVEFTITELPATVNATTVFERADTLTYSDSAGGYTWSNQATSDGTQQGSAIQEVTGMTVSTTSGVVGVVWKQNDRYYVRCVAIAENGNTIPLSVGPKEGYARPPFLLFDPFVSKQDRGNHVLLEPDDTSDAYLVRQVTLDPETGAISWDSSTALGTFTLPVSAAALHSSGRVVAVHTDSGRVGWLHPAATPRPGLAAYSAGPGTQIGLLQSPTAVTVTNSGAVLILEAGANQLAAFDLNGNPIKYFGSNQDQFTQKLVNTGTYLDLSVDGSGDMYLLYYTDDGSQPDDYHVDVYTPQGEPLAIHSPGTNVAKLAVDYFRSIYAANFDPIYVEGTTKPYVDPALNVAEPSISRFDPVAPA
jgi:hypothetical protein